jgi:hypothetical protein
MIEQFKKKLIEMIWGVPLTGTPLSSIKTTTHTCMPDERIDFNTWANKLQVSSKTKE